MLVKMQVFIDWKTVEEESALHCRILVRMTVRCDDDDSEAMMSHFPQRSFSSPLSIEDLFVSEDGKRRWRRKRNFEKKSETHGQNSQYHK